MLICGVKLGNHILSKRHCFIILQRDFHLQHKKKTCECEAVRASMAATSESSASDLKLDLIQTIRSHEVALAELNNLPSSRAVYQKNGNIFFCTTVQKAKASEKKKLDSAKGKLEKLSTV
ncbi:uncharacterized protein LOC110620206 isoform X1 [Manihot esculenta]|uniref:Uncharacterized protein n=2 Tax=Manihot esculenta TaxID=3983 RepID=A0ACB7HE01_MANES|nr:uncharacterized protein LOC110620206 isoform X1 [Manihot esculenta]KAG8649923.1 hypothetical protein MANES_08G157500v8 [Manihot esculenta]